MRIGQASAASTALEAAAHRAPAVRASRSRAPKQRSAASSPASPGGPPPKVSRPKKREGLPTRGGAMPFKLERDTYYTPGQWAEISGYTVKTLATMRSRREMFPYTKLGATIYYKGADLIEALERHQVGVGPQKLQKV